ncbi:uncharacterized protein [Amphiura filiformis]|uniref:uncharacterized protein n=1 Tax=Amphiura filiformis TaxID=82378 RepID=UPI003B21DE8D
MLILILSAFVSEANSDGNTGEQTKGGPYSDRNAGEETEEANDLTFVRGTQQIIHGDVYNAQTITIVQGKDQEPGNSRAAEGIPIDQDKADKDLRDVAMNAGLSHADLQNLFIELGIAQPDIERGERNANSLDFQIRSYHVLLLWKSSNGRKDKRKKILDALVECELGEAKELLEEKWSRTPEVKVTNKIIEDIRKDLRAFYIRCLCKKQMYPWKPGTYVDLNDIFVPLTIDIKIPGARRQHVKKPLIPYTKFLAQDQKDVRFILSGDPGQGKSTFCAKLAHDWSEKKAGLNHIRLLFILELGKLDRSSNIEDAICSQLLSTDYDLNPSILRKVLRDPKLRKAIAVVFDGLDEAATDLLHEQTSNTGNVVKILQYKEMREWKVLVTMRPWRESEILNRHSEYERLELRKLTKSDALTLVTKFFNQNPNDTTAIALGKRLQTHIKQNKHFVDTSTPLAVLLLCWYFAETDGKKGIPERRHQLYTAIFNTMFRMQQHPLSSQLLVSIISVFEIDIGSPLTACKYVE